eukprot:361858-Chlamydomonas_euryale.AAC.4
MKRCQNRLPRVWKGFADPRVCFDGTLPRQRAALVTPQPAVLGAPPEALKRRCHAVRPGSATSATGPSWTRCSQPRSELVHGRQTFGRITLPPPFLPPVRFGLA